ncbi:MAG: hypothetical protein ACR2QF_09485 [Geminicoccaceae bacterium]
MPEAETLEAHQLASTTDYQPNVADLQLLAEIGLSAAVKGNVEVSRPIFEALSLWRPEHPIATIGIALGFIADGEFGSAVDLLKPALQSTPSSPEVAAILLIALALDGRMHEARQLRKTLLNGPDGPSKMIAVRLASVLDG